MEVGTFIRQIYSGYGVRVSDAFILSITVGSGFTQFDEYSEKNNKAVNVAMVRAIPSLLLHPSSVSESGFSISRADRSGIEAYYHMKCGELGIEDRLKSKITFL